MRYANTLCRVKRTGWKQRWEAHGPLQAKQGTKASKNAGGGAGRLGKRFQSPKFKQYDKCCMRKLGLCCALKRKG